MRGDRGNRALAGGSDVAPEEGAACGVVASKRWRQPCPRTVGGRHLGLLGAGCWAWGRGQVAEFGGDAVALGLQLEGVAVSVATPQSSRTRVATPCTKRDWLRTASNRQASRSLSGATPVATTTRRPTWAQVRSERTEQTHTGRSGMRGPRLDGCVGDVYQIWRASSWAAISIGVPWSSPRDQAGVGLVAALARSVQTREQTRGMADALQVGDHDVYLEGVANGSPGGRAFRERGSAESATWPGRRWLVDAPSQFGLSRP
jgi:hypothetical protein